MANILWIDDIAGKDSKVLSNGKIVRMSFDANIFFIENNGHNVKILSSTNDIITNLQNFKDYDLLILDVVMDSLPFSTNKENKYGGIDLLEYFSKNKITIPILIFSVMSQNKIEEEAKRRHLSLTDVGVKKIIRKNTETPEKIAVFVDEILSLEEE